MLGLSEWGTPELGFLMNELTSSLRMIRGMPFASRSLLHKHTHTHLDGGAFSLSRSWDIQKISGTGDRLAAPCSGRPWWLLGGHGPSFPVKSIPPGRGRAGGERRWQIPVCILQREQLQLSYYSMSTWNYDRSGRDGPADENNKEEAEQREAEKNEWHLKLKRPLPFWWEMLLEM